MRILAAIHPPEATEAILACVGLSVRAPPIAPPHPDDAASEEIWPDGVDALPPVDFDA